MNIETHVLKGNGRIPNSRLPVLIYRQAFDMRPLDIEDLFRRNEWPTDWHSSFGMYPRHHFHSDTHELIAVTRGTLVGRFGGPEGVCVTMTKGDFVVIPAGVGHFGESITEDLRLTGAFPLGHAIHDFRLGYVDEYARMVERSRRVAVPVFDPLEGASGSLPQIWHDALGGIH
ncbi:cupin domain-containing protein [Bradyrhizobium cosmicum]|uniref:Cupin 2 conserved barrel domain protein n=1 Tax=Bradyrhizobium cosmicum TaxID=1404864 RepID=A0AAI8QB67_9BRAD|nr:AraC family ligand binding domain-containing protein [Bradyrhizobium cosmicum]BAL75026.1 cupin 2 conserved barrel domain protein [Bradyrhizobium cosmicum]